MKGKWLWIGLTVAVVVLVGAVLGVRYLAERPGVHVLGSDLYVDLAGVGFTFDDETGERIGETPVDLDGHTEGDDRFRGELTVLGYPISEGGTITGDPMVTKTEDAYCIRYDPVCTHSETVEDKTGSVTHFCNYSYSYYVFPGDPDFLAVVIYDYAEEDYYTVILAEDEEQAEERYQWFLAHAPSV